MKRGTAFSLSPDTSSLHTSHIFALLFFFFAPIQLSRRSNRVQLLTTLKWKKRKPKKGDKKSPLPSYLFRSIHVVHQSTQIRKKSFFRLGTFLLPSFPFILQAAATTALQRNEFHLLFFFLKGLFFTKTSRMLKDFSLERIESCHRSSFTP